MTKNAQTEFEAKFGTKKATEKYLVVNNDGNGDWGDPANHWKGPLKIENYVVAETIDLTNHKLESLIVINCPNLTQVNIENCEIPIVNLSRTKLDSSNNPAPNEITDFIAHNNEKLDDVNLKNCKKLTTLHMDKCGFVRKLEGTEDFADSLSEIRFKETTGLHFSGTTYLERLQEVEKVAKDILGEDIPLIPGSEKVDADKLKKDAEAKAIGNNVDLASLGLTGSDATNFDKVKEKLQQATQAVSNLLNEINSSLSLGLTGGDIIKEKVINKIKELINGPSCTHTDYDEIKSQNEKYKNDSFLKKDVVKSNKEIFGKIGISASDYDSKVAAVNVSASQAEKIGNELIEKRFGELSSQNNTSFYLNIALSILAIGSLAAIIYLLLRENKPKTEPESEKEPVKLKKF